MNTDGSCLYCDRIVEFGLLSVAKNYVILLIFGIVAPYTMHFHNKTTLTYLTGMGEHAICLRSVALVIVRQPLEGSSL
ncbi:hypothetical protein Y5S_02818 [Alcanivorax nanhaiticus]|uniref:Uncharacterized protein n=1 Tax=Alcanivorax nanhaiticus TaxID=1177154 RepID=A0A095TN24_9GAMM|nr:hypothetical protein Y5S_02818 [Alcanivorax nanhaiticus]